MASTFLLPFICSITKSALASLPLTFSVTSLTLTQFSNSPKGVHIFIGPDGIKDFTNLSRLSIATCSDFITFALPLIGFSITLSAIHPDILFTVTCAHSDLLIFFDLLDFNFTFVLGAIVRMILLPCSFHNKAFFSEFMLSSRLSHSGLLPIY